MATERFANDVQTTLASSVDSSQGTINVASAAGFPTQPQFRLRIGNEFLLVTGVSGTAWTVSRGAEGSSGAPHTAGVDVVHVVTAGALGTTSDPGAATPGLRSLGTGAQQAASGADSRLSDQRTPSQHHTTHEPGGTDPMAVDAAAGTGSLRTLGGAANQAASGSHTHTESQVTNLTTDLAAKESLVNKDVDGTLAANSDTKYPSQKATKAYVDAQTAAGAPNASDAVKGITKLSTAPVLGTNPIAVGDNDPRNTNNRAPTGHHAAHEPGGSDAMVVDAAPGVASLRTLGSGPNQAAPGNDSRFSGGGGGVSTVAGGTLDDTAAFQAALTSGGIVTLAQGVTYTVTSMTLSSNTVINGNGATVRRKAGAAGDLLKNTVATTNVQIRDVTFDNLHAATGNRALMFIGGSSNVLVERCSFINHDFATFAVTSNFVASFNFKILDCTFIGGSGANNRGSVEFYNVSWVWFERNRCENHGGFKDETGGSAPGVMHHIFCRDNLFLNCDAMCMEIRNNDDGTIEDVVISGNQAYNIGATIVGGKGLSNVGEHVGNVALSSFVRRVSITGNIIKSYKGHGCAIGGGVGTGANGAHPENIVIADNVFDASDQALAPQTGTGGTGCVLYDAYKFSITGNQIRGTGAPGIWLFQNTSKNCAEGQVTGNHIVNTCQMAAQGVDRAGIYFYGNVSNVSVTGNTSQDNGSATVGNCAGIGTDTHTSGTGASGLVITGNRCMDARGTKFQLYGIRLGHVASATASAHPQFCTVAYNDVRGNLTGGVHVFALDAPAAGYRNNNLSGNVEDTFASQLYAATNVTTDRTYDANATTLDELADVVGTLIADLRTNGTVR